jgi:hypothetical protein
MKVIVEKDPSLDACTISHESVHLESPEDIAEWREQLMAGMEAQLGDGRAYLLVDYTDFSVNSSIANEYGRVAEELRARYAKDVFRYGASDPHSFLSARLQSLKRAHRSNVFANRQEAIEALNKVRGRK